MHGIILLLLTVGVLAFLPPRLDGENKCRSRCRQTRATSSCGVVICLPFVRRSRAWTDLATIGAPACWPFTCPLCTGRHYFRARSWFTFIFIRSDVSPHHDRLEISNYIRPILLYSKYIYSPRTNLQKTYKTDISALHRRNKCFLTNKRTGCYGIN